MRHAYLYAQEVNTLPPEALLEKAQGCGLDGLVTSFGGSNKAKLAAMAQKAHKAGIATIPMFSSTKWILGTHKSNIRVAIDAAFAHAQAHEYPLTSIHLDIEPQLMADWDANRSQYLQLFADMLHYIRFHYGEKVEIGVSIHHAFPSTLLERIAQPDIRLYIMAYGTRSPFTLAERLRAAVAVAPESVLALRATDFRTQAEMEHVASEVAKRQRVKHLALYDLRRFCNLPK